jgi:hypothetical protein
MRKILRINNKSVIVKGLGVFIEPQITYAYQMDGVDEYINIPNFPLSKIQRNQAFSWSFWIYPTNTSNMQFIIGRYSNWSGFNVGIFTVSGTPIFQFSLVNNYGNRIAKRFPGVTENEWQHYVFTYDGSSDTSGIKCYRNGVEQTDNYTLNNLTSDVIDKGEDLRFGHGNHGSLYSDSHFDDIKYFSSELSSTQVIDLYNDGVTNTNPDHHWKLGEEDTFDGSNWSIIDSVGNYDGTSVNIEESDRIIR